MTLGAASADSAPCSFLSGAVLIAPRNSLLTVILLLLCFLLLLQANLYPRILAAMKPGATLGLSHGFLLGVLKNDGVDFRKDINVVLVAPKVSSCLNKWASHQWGDLLGSIRWWSLSDGGVCIKNAGVGGWGVWGEGGSAGVLPAQGGVFVDCVCKPSPAAVKLSKLPA